MKKLLLTIPFLIALTPLSAFAAYTYTRTPTGVNPTSPINFTLSFDDFESDFGLVGSNKYIIEVDTSFPNFDIYDYPIGGYNSGCLDATTDKNISGSFNIPVGTNVVAVYVLGFTDVCGQNDNIFNLEYDNNTTLFTISSGLSPTKSGVLFGRSGESQTAIQSGGSALAAVGLVSTNAFTGVFPYLMLSVGVFLTFYIVQKIAMLWGDRMRPESAKIDPEKANWSGKGAMEHDFNEFKKKKRSRIKRGLE